MYDSYLSHPSENHNDKKKKNKLIEPNLLFKNILEVLFLQKWKLRILNFLIGAP